MEVQIILVGKTNSSFLVAGEAEYSKRLKHYFKVSEIVIPELKKVKNFSVDQIKSAEGKLILKYVQKSDVVVLLDDKGKQFSSMNLALWFQKKMNSGIKKLTFVVGGAYGFSEEVYSRADQKLSLSPLTFSHQMVRLIFKEQLYRVATIINNEPYHHK